MAADWCCSCGRACAVRWSMYLSKSWKWSNTSTRRCHSLSSQFGGPVVPIWQTTIIYINFQYVDSFHRFCSSILSTCRHLFSLAQDKHNPAILHSYAIHHSCSVLYMVVVVVCFRLQPHLIICWRGNRRFEAKWLPRAATKYSQYIYIGKVFPNMHFSFGFGEYLGQMLNFQHLSMPPHAYLFQCYVSPFLIGVKNVQFCNRFYRLHFICSSLNCMHIAHWTKQKQL